MTTRSEMEVALRSSRTRTTVPSRISRTIGSSASEREFQASQSPFTLRQTRLTVSLPTSPPNTLRSARRTRRVLVPAKYTPAISASAASAIYAFRDYVEDGGLMSYGINLAWAYRQLGDYASRILKGEKPGELPIQRPKEVELLVNLKTVKALGLTVPRVVLTATTEFRSEERRVG